MMTCDGDSVIDGKSTSSMTNIGGDGAARLTVAEGVALCETRAGRPPRSVKTANGGGGRATSRHVGEARQRVTAVRTPTGGPTVTR